MIIRNIYFFVFFFLLFSCEKTKLKTLEPIPAPEEYVLNIPTYYPNKFIPADNPLTKAGVELGRHLFYEKKLSKDNTLSCGSCHFQRLAFTDGLAKSVGINGKIGKRNAMSLANLVFLNKNFFWDGRANSVEHQAIFPILDSLELNETLENIVQKIRNDSKYTELFKFAFGNSEINSDKIIKAIAQFERSLISINSKYDKYLRSEATFTAQEKLGLLLFTTHPDGNLPSLRGGNCSDCHAGVLQTDNNLRNNGLEFNDNIKDKGLENITGKATDKGKFRVLSLRNIELTAPYMHDGRFSTLEEVLEHYNEHVKFGQNSNADVLMLASNSPGSLPQNLNLSPNEVTAILAFLKTLTDTEFINNPKFKDPNSH